MDTFRNQIHAWTFLPPLLTCLFRHQIRHPIRCQQLPHLQRLSWVFTPEFSLPRPPLLSTKSLSQHFSPFSSNPFHCTTAAAYLQHFSIYCHSHHFTGRPLCASISYLCCDILGFTIYLQDDQSPGEWRVSGGAPGSNHHPLLHNKWACWASVSILVNANRKKRKLQTKRLRIIYAWITEGKLSHNWDVSKKRFSLLFWIH